MVSTTSIIHDMMKLTLQKKRTCEADLLGSVRTENRSTIGGGVKGSVLVVEDLLGRHDRWCLWGVRREMLG